MTIANGNVADATDVLVGLTSAGEGWHLRDGTNAAKPATPAVGDVYVATDIGMLYVCHAANVWRPAGGKILANEFATDTDCKGTGPTTVFSFTVPAGMMGPTGALRVQVTGNFDNSTAGARTPTVSVVWGGTTYSLAPATGIATGTSGAWLAEFMITNISAASQDMFGRVIWVSSANATTKNIMDTTQVGAAVNTAADVAVSVTVAWSLATTSAYKLRAVAEIIP